LVKGAIGEDPQRVATFFSGAEQGQRPAAAGNDRDDGVRTRSPGQAQRSQGLGTLFGECSVAGAVGAEALEEDAFRRFAAWLPSGEGDGAVGTYEARARFTRVFQHEVRSSFLAEARFRLPILPDAQKQDSAL
jgi:hypothetical protein